MERDKIVFLSERKLYAWRTDNLEERLRGCLPEYRLAVLSITENRSGAYRHVKRLPPYLEVVVELASDTHSMEIIIWLPEKWNGRFLGTGGGGTATGGRQYITKPNNTSRGAFLPMGILNGFACATTDSGNCKGLWALDRETGKRDAERIENWRSRGTHWMTVIGKAVTELVYGEPIRYAYFHGGSGGGRQALVEAQEWPEDYDGIWASCPAINWTRFLLGGLWVIAVMNEENHIVNAGKMAFLSQKVREAAGGDSAFYDSLSRSDFDIARLIGQQGVTGQDTELIKKFWDGPRDHDGQRLWYSFYPGTVFWNRVIPVGAYYYDLFGRPHNFIIATHYCRWLTEEPKRKFDNCRLDGFYRLFEASQRLLPNCGADKADLSAFRACGGKLIIDHGTADPLIPVEGTIDYVRRVRETVGETDSFLRLYINPGDGHGSCDWRGPGITEADGMRALMAWVEDDLVPDSIRKVQVNKQGKTLREGEAKPYIL